jgi:hypothetical protein
MVRTLKGLLAFRAKIAARVGRKLEGGEAITHFLYGIAVVTETHGEITFYSVAAICLGCVALITTVIGTGGGDE